MAIEIVRYQVIIIVGVSAIAQSVTICVGFRRAVRIGAIDERILIIVDQIETVLYRGEGDLEGQCVRRCGFSWWYRHHCCQWWCPQFRWYHSCRDRQIVKHTVGRVADFDHRLDRFKGHRFIQCEVIDHTECETVRQYSSRNKVWPRTGIESGKITQKW